MKDDKQTLGQRDSNDKANGSGLQTIAIDQ